MFLLLRHYSTLGSAWLKLREEIQLQGLTPINFPHGIAIVTPYTVQAIDLKRY